MRKNSTTETATERSRRISAGPAAHPARTPTSADSPGSTEPGHDCPLCPRLADFRNDIRAREPHWFNGPVAPFGDPDAALLIVGLAPGLQGANRTGRPFTGDYAGDLLYDTLHAYGFAEGTYEARPDDSLRLVDCRIGNAVRCVPPQNKPLPIEIKTCRPFLTAVRDEMSRLRAVVLLGRVAHDTTLKAFGVRAADAPFGHGAEHQVGAIRLFDSYHCSRYNTNTGVLTPQMFRAVFARVRQYLDAN
ncbi:uracil-DNA glycosylase [Bradyrhizobium sp. U87765 SZCCT0131]|uniref:uracil-DNA glycosylase n=1 Tax=unclassified Bradyrhizobium TaxID=2631580 RepID=UPI001BA4ACD6|nr:MULTISPECIES: uracil-DNA glycosylase [unclassified Bradyrhizobium]MBR1219899.1 uracil-DNA glycosylase [Bradyrhizobium sp. U87765 SZCCT0131]MBR1263645.1 uracil-DNA glycosylase [Bradyrhizobium sp. U87765 SZCCT0134]MBR1309214.1 uracil-DNA glycosylase [Bradyrhizobium sp. U87765 SZCCT0110]MBR1323977.1 uracil-DNA glycosylase [Bradyrhizobium sp. U87765 SZCCT0109]MBR1349529.1 uracil-DNA glycosylase [Bradyrhizobium sp. U87765 SZCCT0048]